MTSRPRPATARDGALAMLPVLAPVGVFGAAFGALAAIKGLSLGEALMMSGVVFAGASQVAALEVWTESLPLTTLALITAAVNARFLLMGATLGDLLAGRPLPLTLGALHITVDPNWAAAMVEKDKGRLSVAFLIGSGLALFANWLLWTGFGHALGAAVADPAALGFDLIIPVYFAAVLAPFWKGRATLVPIGVSGVVATLFWALGQAPWHIFAGALAGALAHAFWPGGTSEAESRAGPQGEAAQ